jgi:hypothetical protein
MVVMNSTPSSVAFHHCLGHLQEQQLSKSQRRAALGEARHLKIHLPLSPSLSGDWLREIPGVLTFHAQKNPATPKAGTAVNQIFVGLKRHHDRDPLVGSIPPHSVRRLHPALFRRLLLL